MRRHERKAEVVQFSGVDSENIFLMKFPVF